MTWTGTVQLDSATMEYVGMMQKTGLYGITLDDVIEGLILAGVRRAIEAGHIKVKTFEASDE